MKKLLLISIILFSSIAESQSFVPDSPPLDVKSYILLEPNTGTVIAEFNSENPIEPASMTKIMTSYVVADQISNGLISLEDDVGLPSENHFSSAKDLANLTSNYINKFPEEYALYKQKQFTFNNIKQLNRNKLLWRDESADGVKTGHTDAAGYCLVGSAKRGGMRLITVVAGSSSDKDRFSDTQRLLEYGFRFFATQKVISADQQLKEIAVWGGLADSLKIGVIQDISLTLPRTSFKDLQINYKHKNNVQAPIKKGELIGSLEIVSGDKVVYAEDLLALESIDSKGFFGRVWSKFILWIMGLFGLNDNGSN